MYMKRIFSLAVIALLTANMAMAQWGGPVFESPVVHDDNTTTFSYYAPDADSVKLSGQFMDGLADLTKNEEGLWSVTVGPIEPDMYPYNFIVNGVSVADPKNSLKFPNEGFQASIVEVTGDEPLVHTIQDVPHGTVSYHLYTSPELGERPLVMYTPPGYEDNPDKEYPILYLLHGTTDTEETWTKVGRANIILDNLIAEGKAKEMIIAMPYGRAYPVISKSSGSLREWENLQEFKKDFMNNLMPYVEGNYRVKKDAESRAIAGFSGGGGTSLYFGLNNQDLFSWVIGFAPGMRVNEIGRNNAGAFEDPEATNENLNLFWIAVGEQDFTKRAIDPYMEILDEKGIEYESFISGGGHTWMNCKLYLSMVAKRLFQN
tara:strand:- start:51884 stop:53005 length:1122 start_codon:yes stop_codon:yes gene_type:complete